MTAAVDGAASPSRGGARRHAHPRPARPRQRPPSRGLLYRSDGGGTLGRGLSAQLRAASLDGALGLHDRRRLIPVGAHSGRRATDPMRRAPVPAASRRGAAPRGALDLNDQRLGDYAARNPSSVVAANHRRGPPVTDVSPRLPTRAAVRHRSGARLQATTTPARAAASAARPSKPRHGGCS
jgi:hypothetical protein